MRKFVVGVLISIVLIGGLQTIASKEAMNSSEQKAITFYQFQQFDEGSSLALAIKNADSTFIMHNHYIVPSRIEMFTFPYGTTIDAVSVNPSDIHELALTKPVQIAPPARLLDGSENDAITSYGSDVVSISGWYAYDVGSGMIDGVHCLIVKVQLFPVQYDPMNMNIRWTESLTIDISYSLPEKVSTVSSDESYELIILTPSEFTSELEPLVSHKNNRDLPTKLITLTDIYGGVYFPTQGRDEPEKIKYFIKDAFEQWGIRYVLLVGGYDEFPTRYTNVYVDYGSGDDENFVSDLYYADILDEQGFCSWDSNDNDQFGEFDWGDDHLTDDIDIYPEVGLGRLACISEIEVTNAVNKIITYETAESHKKDWFSNVLYCGGDTFPGDDESIDEGEYMCDHISKFMSGFSANKLYVTQGTLRTTGDISDGLSDGSGFFILAGHGNPTSWSTHPHENENVWIPTSGFRSNNAASLRNGEKLPVLLTEACSPFKFSASDNCLGWSFVSNPDGGAIAGFGATGLSWGSSGSSVVSYLTSKVLIDTLRSYKQDGAITLGEMWTMGITKYYRPSMDGGEHKSVEEWQLLGDPSLSIAEDSSAPLKPNAPQGPSSGKPDETYEYSAITTDPEGDDVYYLFDWGDGTDSGWLGPFDSGKTCVSSYTWTQKGTYAIKVKAQDFHGVVSAWSDPLEVSMPKSRVLYSLLKDRYPSLFNIITSFLSS